MICFIEIDFDGLKPLVELGFGEDPDLMDKYQQLDTDFVVTVNRNIENIKSAVGLFELRFFKVLYEDVVIGFTVLSFKEKILYSFGINIKYRVGGILASWFEKVNELLGYEFSCILWNKNTRAINHLVRQGMKIIDMNKETTILQKTY